MIQEVKYRGLSTQGSDYDSPDGTLLSVANMIPTESGLRSPVVPTRITTLRSDIEQKVIYLHKMQGRSFYIVQIYNEPSSSYELGYLDESQDYKLIKIDGISFADPIENITSVNNTLIVTDDIGMHYIYYKENGGYLVLDYIPELPIRFSLEAKMEKEKYFDAHLKDDPSDESTDKKVILAEGEQLMVKGNLNKFIADYSVRRGRFIFPFLVRYAYRMYDGSLIMHSAPVLMQTSDLVAPCICGDAWRKNHDSKVRLNISAATHTLFYQCVEADIRQEIEPWSDIIKSVDIFISKPIYTYDQKADIIVSQTEEEAKTPHAMKSVSVCRIDESGIVASHKGPDGKEVKDNRELLTGHNYDQPRTYRDMYLLNYRKIDYNNGIIPGDMEHWGYLMNDLQEVLKVPSRPRTEVIREIGETSVFYLLKSIPLSKLAYARTNLQVPENYLESLTSREVMTDDYDSHCNLIPKTVFSYNNRVNIANIKKEVFNGYSAAASFQKTDGYYHLSVDNDGQVYKFLDHFDTNMYIRVLVYLKKDGKDMIVESPHPVNYYPFGYSTPIFYFYYPDVDAYKAVICFKSKVSSVQDRKLTINLKKHPFLNGAVFCDTPALERDFFYYYKTLTNIPILGRNPEEVHAEEYARWIERAATNGNPPDFSPAPERTSDNFVQLPNKIYTSQVNNPFSFPLLGINTVGSGEILGLSAATTALSKGQVGFLPLTAFTTEGIWALSVNPNTGTYTSIQIIARDVCTNGKSIVSTDKAVLFLTERGLMLLSGGEVYCLSDAIREEPYVKWYQISALNGLAQYPDQLMAYAGTAPGIPFTEYIRGAGVLYDYARRRIYLFNKQHSYVYVYDIRTEQWGTMEKCIQYGINTFPDAIAVTKDADGQYLENFSDCSHVDAKVFILTRPLKLGGADVFKTIRSSIQRGAIGKSKFGQLLLGSNDMANWLPVRSSGSHKMRNISGTPYKYYMIAVVANLNKDDSISGVSLDVIPKLTNKLR